jgi:hypothetical protein
VFPAIFWPLAGFSVAALLLCGNGCWPGIALGALACALISPVSRAELDSAALLFAVTTAAGVTLQAVIGAWALQPLYRGIIRRCDQAPWRVLSLLAVPFFCLVSASLGSVALHEFQALPASALGALWFSWWAGDSLGVLLVMPLIMAWVLYRQHEAARAGLVLLLPLLTMGLVFVGYQGLAQSERLQKQGRIESHGRDLSAGLAGVSARQALMVASVADFMALRREHTGTDFVDFTRRMANEEGVAWLGWAPRVPWNQPMCCSL